MFQLCTQNYNIALCKLYKQQATCYHNCVDSIMQLVLLCAMLHAMHKSNLKGCFVAKLEVSYIMRNIWGKNSDGASFFVLCNFDFSSFFGGWH